MSDHHVVFPDGDFAAFGMHIGDGVFDLASVGTILRDYTAKAGIVRSGNAVTQWLDETEGAAVTDGGVAAFRPTYMAEGWEVTVGGVLYKLPCVRFDGAAGGNALSGVLDAGAAMTAFVVARRAANQNTGIETQTRVMMRAASQAQGIYRQIGVRSAADDPAQSMLRMDGNQWSPGNVTTTGFTANSHAVISMMSSKTQAAIAVNGGALASQAITAISGTVTSDALTIGGLVGTVGINGEAKFAGDIARVLIFAGTLTTQQRQKVEGNLAWEWGIASQLAAGHPYRLMPPSA